MSKNLRYILLSILALSAIAILWRINRKIDPLPGRDGGVILMQLDGGADAGINDAGVPGGMDASGDDGSVVLEVPDAGAAPSSGDAGSPEDIPACGACTFDPVTGVLTLQLQKRFPTEEALNWIIQGVEVIYSGAAPVNASLKPDAGSNTVSAADVNCSASRTFIVNTAGLSPTNIAAINLRLKAVTSGVPFKRMCVKLMEGGVVKILQKNCNCCNCALCTDVGTCLTP
jgi:hypothetical protein